jgi:hypothetical protein
MLPSKLIDHPNEAPWGGGKPSSAIVPGAISNAVFDRRAAPVRPVDLSGSPPARRGTFAFTEYQRANNSKTDFYITEVSRADAIIEPYPMGGTPASVVEFEPNIVEEMDHPQLYS